MSMWPKDSLTSIRRIWLGSFIIIVAFYLEIVLARVFKIDKVWIAFILDLGKALAGLYVLLMLFALINRVKSEGRRAIATKSFPGGLTIHVAIWLFFYIISSVIGLYAALNPGLIDLGSVATGAETINESLIMLFAAGIGSSVTTLLAYLKHASERKDFDNAYVPWYFARPMMGMLLGLIFYFALKGGILVLTVDQTQENLNNMALAAVGSLVGMFSKNALEKLREVFNTLFSTKDPDDKTTSSMAVKPAPPEIVKRYYEMNRERLRKEYDPLAIGLSKKEVGSLKQNVDCIAFTVRSKEEYPAEKAIPAYFVFEAADSKTHYVFTDVREEKEISSSSDNDLHPGDLIKVGNSEGTIGLRVTKKINGKPHQCILSCFHVMCGDDLSDTYLSFDATVASSSDVQHNGKKIGKVIEGKLTDKIDGALASTSGVENAIDHPYIAAPKHGIAQIDQTHIDNPTTLYLSGGRTNSRRGKVNSCNVDAVVKFGKHACTLEDMIVTERMSYKGDSGAPVFLEDGRIVGLLVADSKTKSYIQPILPLIIQLNFQIDYQT